MIHFKAHEFVKLSGHSVDIPISIGVADKIKDLIFELNPVRQRIGKPVVITSSYRPSWWEHYKGRSGNSQHTFEGRGAVDLACMDLKALVQELQHTDFTRICVYPDMSFVHCDYKFPERGQRFFIEWDQASVDDIMEVL